MARRRSRRRKPMGGGIHRPRVTRSGSTFHLREGSPFKGVVRRVNPMMAEYLLGNPRRRRRGGRRRRRNAYYVMNRRRRAGRRYRRNPDGFMRTLQNPMPLLQQATGGLLGIYLPVTVGNLVTDMVGGAAPMLSQPGIMGSVIRGLVRSGVAWGIDTFLRPGQFVDKTAYRVGAAIGIGGSFIMDLLGRPLIIGPGDTALYPAYAFGGFMQAPAMTGTGAYFRRGVAGDVGAYFRRGVGGAGALVPTPRLRGVGQGLMTNVAAGLYSQY